MRMVKKEFSFKLCIYLGHVTFNPVDENSILSMKLSIEFKVKFTKVFKEMVVKKKESRLPDLAAR
jgi:hypothetical protein